jgi:hypothetical protein
MIAFGTATPSTMLYPLVVNWYTPRRVFGVQVTTSSSLARAAVGIARLVAIAAAADASKLDFMAFSPSA